MSSRTDAYLAAKWRLLQDRIATSIFDKESPSSPYEHGYLDALRAVQKEMEK